MESMRPALKAGLKLFAETTTAYLKLLPVSGDCVNIRAKLSSRPKAEGWSVE